MALKITQTDSNTGISYTDSYHRVCFRERDLSAKSLIIVVKVYGSSANATDKLPVSRAVITVNSADFDTYFGTTPLDVVSQNLESQAYVFLKTIDPDEEGSSYPDFPYDYKNDSTDV